MSETESLATDILLPAAGVAVFSKDTETIDSSGKIGDDWRFARVSLDIEVGDVETAIKKYEEYESPELLIIQTENINDEFLSRLEVLSGLCNEGTAAVIIGPVNDVYLYRNLIEMGVSDYLVRPVQQEVLSEVIAKTLVNRLGVSGSRLIALIGTKGGVGTSTIAQAMAWGVSDILEQKTVLIDAAGGYSSLSVGMGFDPSCTLREISRVVENDDEDGLKRMFFDASDRLSVMAGGSDAMLDPTISADQYEAFLDSLMVKAPVILADLSCAEPDLKKMLIRRSNHIVLVTTPLVTSLRFARSIIKEISDLRGESDEEISLLVNCQGMEKQYEITDHDIEQSVEMAPAASIPYLPSLFMANESNSSEILKDKEGINILKNSLLPMLSKTIAVDLNAVKDEKNEKKSGLLGGLLTKMTAK